MAQNIRNLVVSIGGPESPAGAAAARTAVIPVNGLPGLDREAEKQRDDVLIGRNMDPAELLVAGNVAGPLPLRPRPSAGFGMLLNSLLGQEGAPTQIGAMIRMRYTGSEASAKISANTTADSLISEVGDLGSEAGDTNFGTSGTIDLADTATDTIGELVSTINGYTDYECQKIFGNDADDAGDIVDITAEQGKDNWVYIRFSSTTSGAYAHTFPVVLTNTERPTYSVQIDERHDNWLYTGAVADRLTLSAAVRGIMDGTTDLLGFEEEGSQSESGLSLEDRRPFIFADHTFLFQGVAYNFVRNLSLEVINNHDTDGYGGGSYDRQYHQKGMFEATGSFQAKYDATLFAHRAKVFDGTRASLSMIFQTPNIVSGIPGLLLVEMPNLQLNLYDYTENNDQIDASINFRAVNPLGTVYGSPFRVTMITTDSGAY